MSEAVQQHRDIGEVELANTILVGPLLLNNQALLLATAFDHGNEQFDESPGNSAKWLLSSHHHLAYMASDE